MVVFVGFAPFGMPHLRKTSTRGFAPSLRMTRKMYFFFIGSAGRVLAVPAGKRQYLSPEPTRTPSHYQNHSGKFLKGVGKLLSRSFLTKTASPCCSRHSTADFSLQEGGAKKNLSKRNADRRISRSAERAKGYLPLTSQAFEKA